MLRALKSSGIIALISEKMKHGSLHIFYRKGDGENEFVAVHLGVKAADCTGCGRIG